MSEIIASLGAWPLLLVALLVFGFFPGLAARLISLAFHKEDPRRKELIAEVYAVPRWERPFWVAEQLERAITEGLWERAIDALDGRLFNRWTLGDGVARNLEYPDSFWVPSTDDLDLLEPGDSVKLMFEMKGKPRFREDSMSGERMWVRVTSISGDTFEGELANYPIVFNHLGSGDRVRFGRRHIIDFIYRDEDEDPKAIAA